MTKPLVSIVIIFLNAERFLRDAIESVLLQTYDRWELLLVDDGSTDGSTGIARDYLSRDPARIRYLDHADHQNRGASAARNLGVSKAAGRYVAFLDADDIWLPFKLAQQVKILETHPEASVVFGASEYWHGWTGSVADLAQDHTPDLGVEANRVYHPPSLSSLLYPLGTGTAPCPSDLLLRREVFTRVGGFEEQFHGELQLYEDQAFLAKVYLREPVFISSESWIRYRIREDSCVSVVTRAGRYKSVRRHFLGWLQTHLAEHHLAAPAVSAALEDALRQVTRDGPAAGPEPANGSDGCAREHGASIEPVQFGTLRRLTPVSGHWGFDRGLPLDRYYIEQFLAAHSNDIRGHVLEIEDDAYTRRFGGQRVTACDVLHLTDGNERATIVADLTDAQHIPSGTFDCLVVTQTLQYIYDTRAVVKTLERILKPGGVLLATFPGITRIGREKWPGSWFWAFTTDSSRRLFADAFDSANVTVEAFGNVLAASAFLYGLAAQELRKDELDHRDPDFEVLIAVRAVKGPAVHNQR